MELYFKRTEYAEGGLAVVIDCFDEDLECIVQYGVLTVNLSIPLSENQAFVDVNNMLPEIIRKAENIGIMKPVVRYGLPVTRRSGFVEYSLYEFDLDKIEKA